MSKRAAAPAESGVQQIKLIGDLETTRRALSESSQANADLRAQMDALQAENSRVHSESVAAANAIATRLLAAAEERVLGSPEQQKESVRRLIAPMIQTHEELFIWEAAVLYVIVCVIALVALFLFPVIRPVMPWALLALASILAFACRNTPLVGALLYALFASAMIKLVMWSTQ